MVGENNILDELATSFVELHQSQLKSSRLPEIYWKSLFQKIREERFDAGEYFQICMRVDEDDELIGYKAVCTADEGLDQNDPNGVFLVDHAWTYRLNEARAALAENDNLLTRMFNMMNIKMADVEETAENVDKDLQERKIDAVMRVMWKFNQTYKLSTEKLTDEERESIWYVMDEFGSSIRHSDEPSVQCMPFFYIPTATMYSLIWPLRSLNKGDELTRDYVYGIQDEKIRRAKLLPWNDDDQDYLDDLDDIDEDPRVQQEPDVAYFMSGTKDEILPDPFSDETENRLVNLLDRTSGGSIRVYTDLSSVRENLTDKRYTFVEEMFEADVIFMRKHHKDYKTLRTNSPDTLINQFPFEKVVTVKDLLAVVCRRVPESASWLPITYNLSYELVKFIKYFKQRESDELDNHWILKPWNLARSIDMTITNNLNQIIRCQETGPKIACKYITNPVLFYREELAGKVKFDVRYIILVRSIKPLKIYTYNVFWLRFANKPYSLDELNDYEKHFTVMNYKPSVVLKQINCDEFVKMFENQNPDHKWNEVQTKIFKMIRGVFEGASKENPPKGIANNYQSRAMYAIDLMLDWRPSADGRISSIEPMICEINFMPDCTRACKYHPNFFNDVFSTLFLDDLSHKNVTEI